MKQSIKEDLCYLPTKNLCSLNFFLSEEFFPDDLGDVFKQEVVTYHRIDGGIKKTTFVRNFVGKTHYDSTTSEVMMAGGSS